MNGVEALLGRFLPERQEAFHLESIDADGAPDRFEIDSDGRTVALRGTSGVAQAAALNWFLRLGCSCHVSWDATRIELPERLPVVDRWRRSSPYRYRLYMHQCTHAYTAPYWKWERWEQEIDWMALHGVNAPVAVTGYEAVWLAVFLRMGFDEDEIRASLVGPAFLPFQWQGFFDTFDDRPLSAGWIERRGRLQRRILQRQREFGMTPILQAFSGHVPAFVADALAGEVEFVSNIWSDSPPDRRHAGGDVELPGVKPTRLVSARDPLFKELGRLFIQEQIRLTGTDHLYLADPFMEMTPPDASPQFLAQQASATLEAMTSADPAAVWVTQAWPFHFKGRYWTEERLSAYLEAVPPEQLIVLDSYCEEAPQWRRTGAFRGRGWAWCMIQNFGGYPGLFGKLERVASGAPAIVSSREAGRLVGLGAIPEAIEQNPIVFEFFYELGWRVKPPSIRSWIRSYAARRYGQDVDEAAEAWAILAETVYASTAEATPRSLICMRPSRRVEDDPWRPAERGYDVDRLREAWPLLLAAAPRVGSNRGYRHDLVDVVTQILSDLAETLYAEALAGFELGTGELAATREQFLALVGDVDRLAMTRGDRLLGTWTVGAREWGASAEESDRYEAEALRIITAWGPRGSDLHDYAGRHWAGLVGSLYSARWARFFERLEEADRSAAEFDDAAFEEEVMDLEEAWIKAGSPADSPTEPRGEAVAVCAELYARYAPRLLPGG